MDDHSGRRDRGAGILPSLGRAAPDATVAVVSICGPERLADCLVALDRQQGAPSFDIVVAYDPERTGGERLRATREDVLWVPAPSSPPLLAAAAVRAARGAMVLLTEDHCMPCRGWVRRLHAAATGGAGTGIGAVGGPVVLASPSPSALEWAFHFSDFAAYVPPVHGGSSRSLSVCNVAYPRATLERLRSAWVDAFHETRVHAAIRRDVGPLVLVPDARVVTGRRIRLLDALRERYALGRVYGAVRFSGAPAVRRSLRAFAAPLLPPLLLARLARRSWRTRQTARFLRGLPCLVALVCVWSYGETLGLLTSRAPRVVSIVPEPVGKPVAGARRS